MEKKFFDDDFETTAKKFYDNMEKMKISIFQISDYVTVVKNLYYNQGELPFPCYDEEESDEINDLFVGNEEWI